MSDVKCPQCGTVLDGVEAGRLDRCRSCGTLLATSRDGQPLIARPRLDAPRARLLVARSLTRSGRSWLPGDPQLVFFPFCPTNSARRPFVPLAHLPPALAQHWRPVGADLLTWSGAASAGLLHERAVRVPASLPSPAEQPMMQYPFFRVPLRQEGRDSAAWVDASSEQVILPSDLSAPPETRRTRLAYDAMTAVALGAAAGLLLPFPVSLLPLAGLGAVVWWRARGR